MENLFKSLPPEPFIQILHILECQLYLILMYAQKEVSMVTLLIGIYDISGHLTSAITPKEQFVPSLSVPEMPFILTLLMLKHN